MKIKNRGETCLWGLFEVFSTKKFISGNVQFWRKRLTQFSLGEQFLATLLTLGNKFFVMQRVESPEGVTNVSNACGTRPRP